MCYIKANKWFRYYTFSLCVLLQPASDPWRGKVQVRMSKNSRNSPLFCTVTCLGTYKNKDSSANFFSGSAQSWRNFLAEFSCEQLCSSQLHLGCFVPAVNWHLENLLLASLRLLRCPQPDCRSGTCKRIPTLKAIGITCVKLVKLLIFSRPLWRDPVLFGIYAGVNVNYLTVVVWGPACCSTRRLRDN